MNKKIRGFLLALVGGIFWGFSGCCGQYLFQVKQLDSNWLSCVRILTSGLMLIAISLIFQRKNFFAALRCRKDFLRILCFGVFGLMLCQLSYLTAIKHTNAATATVIQYVGPVLVMLTVCLMRRRRPTVLETVSVCLAVLGTFLIATHGNPSNMVISQKGLVWCIIAALTVVSYTLIPGAVTAKYSGVVVNAYGMTAGGIVLLFAFRAWQIPVSLDAAAVLAIAGIVIIGTVAAFTMYLQAVSDIGPIKASIIASIEPISSAVISALWLKSRFEAIDLLGFVMIISTVIICRVGDFNKKQTSEKS